MPAPSVALLKLFHALPIFVGLNDDEISAVAQLSTQKLYALGDKIFNQGDPGLDAYIVVRGRVEIVLPDGQSLATITSGRIFGELAFLDGQPRTAGAQCTEPTILLALPRDAFDALCTMEPHLGMVVVHNIAIDLAAKLRRADGTLSNYITGKVDSPLQELSTDLKVRSV